VDKLDVYKKK